MSKPFKVLSQEEGRGKVYTEEFATLEEASIYIQDRWQGPDYIDGIFGFHTDYSTYELVGFTLKDIGQLLWNAEDQCREYEFNDKSTKRTE
jgi:hypothetical protein